MARFRKNPIGKKKKKKESDGWTGKQGVKKKKIAMTIEKTTREKGRVATQEWTTSAARDSDTGINTVVSKKVLKVGKRGKRTRKRARSSSPSSTGELQGTDHF